MENSHPSNAFQNLRTLKISECSKLEQLVPSSVSLLTILEVSRCDGLINLTTLSTAESLVKLRRMKISDCKMIEEITELQVGEEVKKVPIVFSQLEYLELNSLARLESFWLRNHTLEFPYLGQVVVRGCPNMKIFSQEVLCTPMLHKVQMTEESFEWVPKQGYWEGNLNSTIQKLSEEMVCIYFTKISHASPLLLNSFVLI